MKIERMEVSNWRGLSNAALDFSAGVTIIGGPNESGKTTLRSALRAALLLPTGVRGESKAIEANRPWQTKLCPKVKLIFEIDGKSCIVEKEFLKKKGEWASLKYDGRLLANDEEVQTKLLEILGPSADWIDILWGEQGQLTNDRPAPDSLKGRLAAAAQDTVMPEVAKLEMLIEEEYAQYWTEKKGNPTKKLQGLRDVVIRAEKRIDEINVKIAMADARTEKMEKERVELDILKAKYEEKKKKWQVGNDSLNEWVSYGKYKAEHALANSNFQNAQTWANSWHGEYVGKLKTLWTESEAWKLKAAAIAAKTTAAPSRQDIERISAQKSYLELLIASQQYAEVEAIEVPNSAELRKLRETETNLREIDSRLKTGELHAKLLAERQLNVSLSKDGAPVEQFSLGALENKSFTAEKGFELKIPGVATLSIDSGNPATASDMVAREAMQQELASALKRWRTENIDDLAEKAAGKSARQSVLKRIEPHELAEAKSKVEDIAELDALSNFEAEQFLESLKDKLRIADEAWNAAQVSYGESMTTLNELNRTNPEARLNACLGGLKTHWQSYPFPAVIKLEILAELSNEWFASLEEIAKPWADQLKQQEGAVLILKEKMIRPDGEELSAERLQALQNELQSENAEIEKRSKTNSEAVGSRNAEGDLHATLVTAIEECARAQEEVDRVELDAFAVRKLHDTFEEVRARLQEDVVAPLTSKITGYFNTITSGFYDKVMFDSSLKVGHVSTPKVDAVSLDDISFGTREQLFLLTRLGLAELLSLDNMKQVIILDDNLVHTDDNRMAHARLMLEQAAQSVQVIIFTCHPERYKGIAGSSEASIKSLNLN